MCAFILTIGMSFALFPQDCAAAPDPAVRISTSVGDIVVRLDARKAPISTANFVQYVRAGFYDGTIFHRVIKNFMIQGGGLTPDLKEQKGGRPAIRNEADNGLKNRKYTIAMARTSEPHSATSQFFINVKDNDFLDFRNQTPQGWGYAVFGKVIKGQEVVDKIAKVTTGKKGFWEDVPMEAIVIRKAEMVE
ncbi:MAG: peptidyl-prolyl cis-trans isomerase [Desulfovibrio sp.]|nr:peptidyl-prolyl cis-trans isomerase [Desulfovibrio sp.]